MAHSGDGTGWDTAVPANSEPVYKGALEIRDLRTGVGIRMDKEHIAAAASSVGGEHKQGSARPYYLATASAPTTQVDGGAFAATDLGLLWIDTTLNQLKILTATTPTWASIGSYLGMAWSNSGTDPTVTQVNTTAEDTNGGRETVFSWKGTQSGSEETTLAKMTIAHDGTGDDQKGKITWATNDGDEDDDPGQDVGSMVLRATGKLEVPTGGASGNEVLTADQVDDSSIEVASSVIQVKAGGITAAMLADYGAGAESFTIGSVVVKSGYVAVSGDGTTNVSFLAPFSTALVSVVATAKYTGSIQNLHSISSEDVNGFTIKAGITYVTGYYWIAIGH